MSLQRFFDSDNPTNNNAIQNSAEMFCSHANSDRISRKIICKISPSADRKLMNGVCCHRRNHKNCIYIIMRHYLISEYFFFSIIVTANEQSTAESM